jgi:hypothetical protein
MLAGAATMVMVVSTVVGCGRGQDTHKSATPLSSTPPATSAPPAPILNGTYRLDQDGAKVTTNGAPSPTSNVTSWYVFRSSCGPTGCTATGTRLDDNNHQVAFTPASTTVMHFVGGHWQKVPAKVQQPEQRCLGPNATIVAGEETEISTLSWEPQRDDTLRGVKTETVVTNECGNQGTVWQYPMVAKRVGAAPPGVTVADPAKVTASPATTSTAPAVAGPVLNGAYRLDFDRARQTRNGAPIANPVPDQTDWWAFRSLCRSSGCVATAVRLSGTNQEEASGIGRVLRFTDGHWQLAPYIITGPCTGTAPTATDTKTVTWSWDPQPDGTLHGVDTLTVLTDECGHRGTAFQTPMVVTRVGDVPPTVVLADPALF